MKKLVLIVMAIATIAKSQDIITLKNGEEINAKIIEIGTSEIKYKKNETSPLYVINKDDIFMIKYQDGTKDLLNKSENKNIEKRNETSEHKEVKDSYSKGVLDANKYYKGENCGAVGTAATTLLLSPLIGIIPAAICSSAPPQINNLKIPNYELMNNPEYMRGYTETAHGIKKGKIWRTWGICFAFNVVLVLLIVH